MGHIYKEVFVQTNPDRVWAAVRDVGAVHQRIARGFVVDTRLDGDSRIVTFKGGTMVRISDLAFQNQHLVQVGTPRCSSRRSESGR